MKRLRIVGLEGSTDLNNPSVLVGESFRLFENHELQSTIKNKNVLLLTAVQVQLNP